MINNKDYYPTPDYLIEKMFDKVKKHWSYENYFLEPSAGSGNILDWIEKSRYGSNNMFSIEKDEDLINILRGKGYNVLDRDFLSYNGPDKFSMIIMNPPFSNGANHLLKAIDIMYSGHIVCLLNAETLKNPCNQTRMRLQNRLTELKADVEFLSNTFVNAERPTNVEVALIHIHIDRKVEDDIFRGTTDADDDFDFVEPQQNEITKKDSIKNMVADYNRTVKVGTQVLMDFYKNYNHVANYISLEITNTEKKDNCKDLTEILKRKMNYFLIQVRQNYWRKILEINQVRSRMTEKKIDEFNVLLQKNAVMDFTESNVRTFILNLIDSYDDVITEAVVEIFDRLSYEHAWDKELHNKNTHYYNGWKTNKAFYVNEKVIIPNRCSNAFIDEWNGRWRVDYTVVERLNDIDKVMNHFDGRKEYVSIVKALDDAFVLGESRKIKSTYFELTAYKKGTLHLKFLDEDILRRFNITACRDKNMLPYDYGTKDYTTLDPEEKATVDSFEGKKSYQNNLTDQPTLFVRKDFIQLEENNQKEV